jgi:hypothetical protein
VGIESAQAISAASAFSQEEDNDEEDQSTSESESESGDAFDDEDEMESEEGGGEEGEEQLPYHLPSQNDPDRNSGLTEIYLYVLPSDMDDTYVTEQVRR